MIIEENSKLREEIIREHTQEEGRERRDCWTSRAKNRT